MSYPSFSTGGGPTDSGERLPIYGEKPPTTIKIELTDDPDRAAEAIAQVLISSFPLTEQNNVVRLMLNHMRRSREMDIEAKAKELAEMKKALEDLNKSI